jgi:hypothetical protein
MRYMLIVKSDAKTEAGEMPDDEFERDIGNYNDELVKSGAFLTAEGLQPSSKGARLTLIDGKRTLNKGPFSNPETLVAGYWIIKADSNEEAIDWAKRAPFKTGQVEVRQIFEPWGQEPSTPNEYAAQASKASGDLKRFFCIANANSESEAGIPPTMEMMAEMGEYMGKKAAQGTLLGGEGLMRSALGARVDYAGSERTVTDGPFVETKELIGGFGLIQAKSLDDAIDEGWDFLEVGEIKPGEERTAEIREVFDFPA